MSLRDHSSAIAAAKSLVLRSALAVVGTQAAVVVGLVLVDAAKKRRRTRRKGFPHPGVFESRVARTRTTIYTCGEDFVLPIES